MTQKAYAFFDFDGTLRKGDSIVSFCLYARKRGWVSRRELFVSVCYALGYGLHLVSAEASKQAAMRFLEGKSIKQVQKLSRDYCREVLMPTLYPEGINALKSEKQAGREVWLVSASTGFYLEPLKQLLPIDRIVATRMDVRGQLYTGRLSGHNCRGVEKPLRIAEVLSAEGSDVDYAASRAYGDSAGDAPMLRLCAEKVAVNAKKGLRKALATEGSVTYVRWGRKP